jgi:hypothetical protein
MAEGMFDFLIFTRVVYLDYLCCLLLCVVSLIGQDFFGRLYIIIYALARDILIVHMDLPTRQIGV